MAFKTVAEYKDAVAGLLTGTNLKNVTNLNGALERAARTMIQKADIPEATGREAITLYDGVYDYLCPSSIFGSAFIDFRPTGISRGPWDFVQRHGLERFDRVKGIMPNGYRIATEFRDGVQILRVAQARATPRVLVDACNATSGWSVGGSASSLAVDNTIYYQEPASLRFNLAAAGSQGYIEKTLSNSINLSTYEGIGMAFVAVYLPDAANITSIGVRIGNDSSNYWFASNTVSQLGAFTSDNFILIPCDLSASSTVGTVDAAAVDYVRVVVNYDGTALPNIHIGNVFVSLPSPHEVIFQSPNIFQTITGVRNGTITNDTDSIILNGAAYTIYEYEGALAVAVQMGGSSSSPLVQQFEKILNDPITGLYPLYKGDNPSEEIRQVGSWYDDEI